MRRFLVLIALLIPFVVKAQAMPTKPMAELLFNNMYCYVITASAGANGTISPSGSVLVVSGASQRFTFSPSAHYHLASLTIDGSANTDSTAGYTFRGVVAAHTIAVTFSIDTYNIVSSAGANGSISPLGTTTVNYNGSQVYTITPASLHVIDSVKVDAAYDGTATASGSKTFSSVVAAHTISVTFKDTVYYGGNHTFFVDAVNGNDNNLGYGKSDSAWKTIAKVNGFSFGNGDSILLQRGCTWNEQLVVPRSGLYFGNYGSGAKPMIDAADVMTGWTLDAGSVYKKTGCAHNYSAEVFQDATRLTIAGSRGAMTQGSAFFYASNSTLYVWCSDNANPSTHAIETPINWYSYCIDFNGKDAITVNGIDGERAAFGYTFENVVGTHTATITGCALYDMDHRGIDMGGYNDLQITNILCDHDTVLNSNEEGFWFGNGTIVAQYCYASGNWPDYRVGIRAVNCKYLYCKSVNPVHGSMNVEYESGYAQATGTVISNCWLQGGTGDDALENRGANTTITDNVIIGNNSTYASAIRMYAPVTGAVVYNNTIIGNGAGAVIWLDNLQEVTFKNNIVVGVSNMELLATDNATHDGTWVPDYNDWQSTGGFQLGGTHYSTLSAFAAVVGGDSHSITSDPLFTTNYTNLHLQSTSPCVNRGTNVSLTTDFDGNPIQGIPDIGAFEYQTQ